MQPVINVSESSFKSLLNPWRTQRVWVLLLHCGHTTYRPKSRFPQPPKRVKCHDCESESKQVYKLREAAIG